MNSDSNHNNDLAVFVVGWLDVFRLIGTISFLGCVFILPQSFIGRPIIQERFREVLRKYYSEEEIISQNIHYVEARTRLKLSNGVELPVADHQYVQGPFLLHYSFGIVLFLLILDYVCGSRNMKFFLWFWKNYESVNVQSRFKNTRSLKLTFVFRSLYYDSLRAESASLSNECSRLGE